jgi:hypothetical protein
VQWTVEPILHLVIDDLYDIIVDNNISWLLNVSKDQLDLLLLPLQFLHTERPWRA